MRDFGHFKSAFHGLRNSMAGRWDNSVINETLIDEEDRNCDDERFTNDPQSKKLLSFKRTKELANLCNLDIVVKKVFLNIFLLLWI